MMQIIGSTDGKFIGLVFDPEQPLILNGAVFVADQVDRKGLEPPRLAAPEPKSGASTNSATWAHCIVSPALHV